MLGAWCYAIASTLRLYFDFSGYSDMAIGVAGTLGFTLPENFDYPFKAKSISDFWRRWHITLSAWFKEYIYIPLGGNRKGSVKMILNVLTVWLITGLWHGMTAGFIIWGIFNGLLIAAEKLINGKSKRRVPVLSEFTVILLITVGFSIFFSTDLADVVKTLGSLVGAGVPFYDERCLFVLINAIPLIMIGGLIAFGIPEKLMNLIGEKPAPIVRYILVIAGLGVSVAYIISGNFLPFIYASL